MFPNSPRSCRNCQGREHRIPPRLQASRLSPNIRQTIKETGTCPGMTFYSLNLRCLITVIFILSMAGVESVEARTAADQAFYWEAWRVCNSNFYPEGTRPYINYQKHWFRCVEPWPRKQNGKRN